MGDLSICVHIVMIKYLLDNFEHFKYGLCHLIGEQSNVPYSYKCLLREYLGSKMPKPKYSGSNIQGSFTIGGYVSTENPNVFSWPQGDIDRRRYWLKDRLKELEKQLK